VLKEIAKGPQVAVSTKNPDGIVNVTGSIAIEVYMARKGRNEVVVDLTERE